MKFVYLQQSSVSVPLSQSDPSANLICWVFRCSGDTIPSFARGVGAIWHSTSTWDKSGQDPLDHFAVHVGEPEVAAGVVEGELLVVEAEELEDGGLKVVDVHGV